MLQSEWFDFNITDLVCAPTVEDAIETLSDWIDCELLSGNEHIIMRGITSDVNPEDFGCPADPLWKNGNDRIYKRLRVDEVHETYKRWLTMGRMVERFSVH